MSNAKGVIEEVLESTKRVSEDLYREAVERYKRAIEEDARTEGVAIRSGVRHLGAHCDTCSDAFRCCRINQCLRYKCEFGKVDKP